MNTQSTVWNDEMEELAASRIRVLECGVDYITYIDHRTEEIWTEPVCVMAQEIHHTSRSLHIGK